MSMQFFCHKFVQPLIQIYLVWNIEKCCFSLFVAHFAVGKRLSITVRSLFYLLFSSNCKFLFVSRIKFMAVFYAMPENSNSKHQCAEPKRKKEEATRKRTIFKHGERTIRVYAFTVCVCVEGNVTHNFNGIASKWDGLISHSHQRIRDFAIVVSNQNPTKKN